MRRTDIFIRITQSNKDKNKDQILQKQQANENQGRELIWVKISDVDLIVVLEVASLLNYS